MSEGTKERRNEGTEKGGNEGKEGRKNEKKKNEETKEQDTSGEQISLQEAIKEQAREDEQPQSANFTLRKILGGDWLTADFLRRQIGVILLIVGFTIVYISNRYSCQKDMLEIDRLNAELTDAKYKALSSSSELTEKCRESNVLDLLRNNKDSVLKIANQPPYIINIPQ
ncbi:MAG: hypothetical protein IKH99_07265 [Prevotella sp.]|nr:hypothetical protein [Prevotella sp.]